MHIESKIKLHLREKHVKISISKIICDPFCLLTKKKKGVYLSSLVHKKRLFYYPLFSHFCFKYLLLSKVDIVIVMTLMVELRIFLFLI